MAAHLKSKSVNPIPHKQMRILHITSFFHPHIGGSQRYMEELFSRLIKKYPNISVDVLCYNTDSSPEIEHYRGLTIYRIPCWQILPTRFNIPSPFSLLFALWKLRGNKYSNVHTHLRFFDTTWWAWIYAKIIHATSIFTEHVASHPVHQHKFVEWIAIIVDQTLAKICIPQYNIITVTNKRAQTFLQKTLHITKNINLLYGGVDTQYFSPNKTSLQIPGTNKHISKDTTVIAFAGRFIWTKGVTYLYEAIKEMKDTLPKNIIFVLAGGGELEDRIKNSIKRDSLSDKIIMTGSLTTEQIRDLLRLTDIFIHPSHHNEGFPNSILEAGSCGCLVIATDTAGTDEIINNNYSGLIIEQRNSKKIKSAIEWSLKHKKERTEMGINLRNSIITRYDWSIIVKQYHDILSL